MWTFLWTPKTSVMVKVIVTLTAAAGAMFGQLLDTGAKSKCDPVKKEVHQQAHPNKPIL